MSAKMARPPKDAPFAVKLAYYAGGRVTVHLCPQMKYYAKDCRGHLVDRYCPAIRGRAFVSGPCRDWHTPDRARRAGQKILARMRRQLADIALEEALTKAFNGPLTDDELSIVDAAYERGMGWLAEVRINMLECRIATLQADLSSALAAASEKTQKPPERHAICGICGWTGPESGLFDDGKFIFCPQCRNYDGNTLRPVETAPAGNG